jgi:ElaB/YqjD/DUF883 family membrane-anchored ribosome-binding protein
MESMSKSNPPSNMQDATERARSAAHTTVDKVADAAQPAVERLAAGAHQTVDKLASAAGTAAQVMGEKSEKIKLAQERLLEDCRGYVRENPIASVGIALAAGYLLSRLISSR